ncbi:MAG TPA: hypothetical protein VGL93_22055 [Streptosporangiaceae bacterium]|jgi:hypothetical protein
MSTAAGRPAPPVPPQDVTETAARLGFGEPRDARQDASPRVSGGIGCGGAIVCLLLLIGLAAITSHLSIFSWAYSLLHAVGIGLLIAGASLAIFGFRGLAGGSRSNFLYAGGIVHRHRSKITAVAWRDAVRMRPVRGKQRGSEGKVLAYVLQARDGASFPVVVAAKDGRDPFLDQVIDAVRSNGGVVE